MADTRVARLDCDESTARRIAALLGETLPEDVAVSAFEKDEGQWAVAVHFGDGFPKDKLQKLIAGATDADVAARVRFETVAQQDWIKASLEGLPIVRAGRFVVHGAHHRGQIPANAIGIEIEAALAVGTGHHGTTRGCLLALDALLKQRKRQPRHPEVRAKRASKDGGRSSFEGRLRRPPQDDGSTSVLDVGTGTGVLAIAAGKALRQRVCATDIDPVAVTTARTNARHNTVGALIAFHVADGRRALPWRGPFDLIFANILLGPLTRMARPLARRLSRGGHIMLSGLTPDQANAARAAYAAHGLHLERRIVLENWVTLMMRRG
jgi:ribosomal protein L11 methyltransferase